MIVLIKTHKIQLQKGDYMEKVISKCDEVKDRCDCCGWFGGVYKMTKKITLKHKTINVCKDCYANFKWIVNSK